MVPAPAPAVVCAERRSNRVDFSLENFLSSAVTLRASDIDCSDWSNTGNPSNIDGVQVPAAGRHTWTMERALAASRAPQWRLTATGDAGADWKGRAWLYLGIVGNIPRLVVQGGSDERIGAASCTSTSIAPTTEPASTGVPMYPTRPKNFYELLLFSDGRHIVMRACGIAPIQR